MKRRTHFYGFCTQNMVFTFFRATTGSLGLTTPLVVVLQSKLPNLQEVQVLKWTFSHI